MRLYKTAMGQSAFKQRSNLFTARQRSLFLLFDGVKSLDEVLRATAGMGVAQADVEHLLSLGFLSDQPQDSGGVAPAVPAHGGEPSQPMGLSQPADLSEPAALTAAPRSEQQRYFDAKPIATQLTASLGLRGFMLNLAVEAAAGYADLLKLLPKIQAAVGTKACRKLERALLD